VKGHFIEIYPPLKKWFHYWALYSLLREIPKALPKNEPFSPSPSSLLHGNKDHQMGEEADGEPSNQVPLFLIQFQISRIL